MIPGARRLANSAVCKSSPADHLLQILMSAKQFHGIDFLEFSTAAFVNTVCKKAINFSFQMLCIFFFKEDISKYRCPPHTYEARGRSFSVMHKDG